MSAYYHGSVGHSTQSKTGGKIAFIACLLAGEAATCLGLLASFDYVAQVENRVMTRPAGHRATAGADGSELAGRCRDLAGVNAFACERVSNHRIARNDELTQEEHHR